jgi:hypothetical protein
MVLVPLALLSVALVRQAVPAAEVFFSVLGRLQVFGMLGAGGRTGRGFRDTVAPGSAAPREPPTSGGAWTLEFQ